MRTLKKTLCLVLCLAMMAGLCVIGTSAAFTDMGDSVYTEAVDVLVGIGVINGMTEDTFAPTATLTRAQACKIIAYLLKEEDVKATSTFVDAQGHWAESFIALCAAKGIVDGVSATEFAPEATLTGAAWAKMLLCALGYNAANEGMTGDGWEVGVGTLVKKSGLAAGIKAFDGAAAVARDAACQMAFNALFVEEVAYASGGTTITTGDVTITTGASAAAGTGDFLADLHDITDTTAGAADDAYGRPATQEWSVDGKVVSTTYAAADYTYVPANDMAEADAVKAIAAAYAKVVGVKATDITVNLGSDVCAGETYEFTYDKTSKTMNVLVGFDYDFAVVLDVKATTDTGVEYTKDITLDHNFDGTADETVHEDALTLAVAKGDVLAIPYSFTSHDNVWADAVVMTAATGKMTAQNATTGTVTIGGQKLAADCCMDDADSAVSGKDFASTLTYYVSPVGTLAVVKVYEEAFTYTTTVGYATYSQAQAYGAAVSGDLLGAGAAVAKDGRAVLEILTMDGKTAVYDLAVKQDAKNEETTFVGKDSIFTGVVPTQAKTAMDMFVEYYTNEDGTIVVVNAEAPITVETTKAGVSVTVDGSAETATSSTVVNIVNDAAAKFTTKTITGYKNFVDATYSTAYAVMDKTNTYVAAVYAVDVPAAPVVVAPVLAFCKTVGDETAKGTEVTLVVDGKEVTYLQETAVCEAGKYYELKVSDGVILAATTETAPTFNDAKIATVDANYIDTDAGVIEFAKNTNTYDISGKSLTLAKGVIVDVFQLTANDLVIFIVGKA